MSKRGAMALVAALAALFGLFSCAGDAGNAPPPQVEGAVIEGVVREWGTERPIAGAVVYGVTASNLPGPRTTADADGRFFLTGLQEGRHVIAASKYGYVFPNRFEVTGSTFHLVHNEKLQAGTLYLTPAGSLAGRVLKPDGSPARKVEVQLLRNSFVMGRNQWTFAMPEGTRSRVETNHNGEFLLVGVDPGEFLVRFVPREVTEESVIPGGKPPGPALYPGVRDPASAERVVILPGRETRLKDVQLAVDQRGWIKVYITDESDENLEGFGEWSLEPQGWVGSAYPLFQDRIVNNAHEFQPDSPGTYVISAQWPTTGGVVGGRITVQYANREQELNLKVEKPEGKVLGTVMLQDASGAERPAPEVEVSIGPEIPYFGRTGPDGTYQLEAVFAGRYKLGFVRNVPADGYVARVRAGNRDVLREDLQVLDGRETRLDILVAQPGGTITGTVSGDDGKPVHNALIAVVPQGMLRSRSDYYGAWQSTHSDQKGGFEFRGVVPGEYVAYAWLGAPQGAVRNDKFLSRYDGKGMRVSIRAAETIRADLKLAGSTP